MRRRIVLLGPPASGKGTQAALIHERFGFPIASPGTILREEKKRGSSLGEQADELTSQGKLLPDTIIVELVRQWLLRQSGCFVFDGFPRTMGQASALDEILKVRGTELDIVIALDADRATLEDRVRHRVVCEECGATLSIGREVRSQSDHCPVCGGRLGKRRDDTIEVFAARFEEYGDKTLPLIKYYAAAGLLRTVPSVGTPELVFGQVNDILEGK